MQRLIQLFLATAMVVFFLVSDAAAAFNHGLPGGSASIGKRRMTNADRLARGLPPNPPAARFTPGVVRTRDGASATTTSSSSSTSISPSTTPTPPVTCPKTGYLEFYTADGHYLSANTGRNYDVGQDNAALVTFDGCAPGPVNMQCLNCNADAGLQPEYIGVYNVSTASGWELTFMTTTQLAPYGTPSPLDPPSTNISAFETAVWLYDNATSIEFTVQWVTDNGTAVFLEAFVSDSSDYVLSYDTYRLISFHLVSN